MHRATSIRSAWVVAAFFVGLAAAPLLPAQRTDQARRAGNERTLEARYADQIEELRAEVLQALPKVDDRKKVAYLAAREAEKAAVSAVKAKQEALQKVKGAVGLLNQRKEWVAKATKGVAEAQQKLERARELPSDAEESARAVTAARKALAEIQANYDLARSELKKSQEAADNAKAEEPALTSALAAAEDALTDARAKVLGAVDALRLTPFLSRATSLDAKLAKYVVLTESTPGRLATFAQQGPRQKELIDRLLADDDLMTRMIVADGAASGDYGRAMEIYAAIQEASQEARRGTLERLALAVALEHAEPVRQRNAESLTDGPKTVDPVKRYLHYQKAFLDGELDPAFKTLDVFEYRMVVNGEEPDDILTWGRTMLRNFRPDLISTSDTRWRYVDAVRTELVYGSKDNKYDKPELQFFQNILMNGGICGRRAFFGRFLLRAFGIPTTARPQRGHAALVHWTPTGWVICLGAGWGSGWTKTPYRDDRDFLAHTQARSTGEPFLQVKRAQWIGRVLGEKPSLGFHDAVDPAFWHGVALYRQRAITESATPGARASVDAAADEASEPERAVSGKTSVVDTDRAEVISIDARGVITIPAVACTKPGKSTRKIRFMESSLGGMQLHHARTGGNEELEYTLMDVSTAGTYTLTARVVTPTWKQHLRVTVNDAKDSTDIPLPFTVGLWDQSAPVLLTLVKGKNVLTFSRDHEGLRGVTIKDFTLTPTH